MKLYYAPGACSLSPHIALREAEFLPDLVRVDLAAKKTASGEDYRAINPNGYVPALVLDDGSILTEGPAILQYVADRVPEKGLAPANGSLERYRLQSVLNFITSELHKTFGLLFNPLSGPEVKELAHKMLARRLKHADSLLAPGPYAMGETFTVADCYLFTVLRWAGHAQVDVSPWPRMGEYLTRIAGRPAVQAALRAEGLA